MIVYTGLTRKDVLIALHNHAITTLYNHAAFNQINGSFAAASIYTYGNADPDTVDEAITKASPLYVFETVKWANTRVQPNPVEIYLMVSLANKNHFDATYYDAKYGEGAAEKALEHLRPTKAKPKVEKQTEEMADFDSTPSTRATSTSSSPISWLWNAARSPSPRFSSLSAKLSFRKSPTPMSELNLSVQVENIPSPKKSQKPE